MLEKYKNNNINISIIGLGYVGLPLAIEFGKYFNVCGFDVNSKRINSLKNRIDINSQVSKEYFLKSKYLNLSSDYKDLNSSNVYIITVPTPIYKNNIPNLSLIYKAIEMITKCIKKNDLIILESTVFPGVTEDICGRLITKKTGFKLNKDFFMGYSPERINPGDKKNNLVNIVKIVSGSDNKTLKFIYKLYSKIIKAGVYKVESIKIAEAAKVIENTQRDINIAIMNEFSNIFDKININSNKIFKAASTKWNFLNFKPGLVGGHCIGVDPYYLSYIAKKNNYKPNLIESSRRINNSVPLLIFNKVIKETFKLEKINKKKYKSCLILGATFKENCSDIRNSKIEDVFKKFKRRNFKVSIYDPVATKQDIKKKYKRNLITKLKFKYDIILLLVPHSNFKNLGINKIKKLNNINGFIFDYTFMFSNNQFIYK